MAVFFRNGANPWTYLATLATIPHAKPQSPVAPIPSTSGVGDADPEPSARASPPLGRGKARAPGPGTVKRRGRKKRRSPRLRKSAAARRAAASTAAGGLPLGTLVDEGLLPASTGASAGPRARPTPAEHAHVLRLSEGE